jgi:hypothetical protein
LVLHRNTLFCYIINDYTAKTLFTAKTAAPALVRLKPHGARENAKKFLRI